MQGIEVTMYSDAVPQFAHEPLDRLYRHLHSSLAYHSVYGNLRGGTHTCVLRQGAEIVAVVLFRFDGKRVRVINEQCVFPPAVIDAFARHIFERFPATSVISFPVIDAMPAGLRYPFMGAKCTQDIVLALPASEDQYQAMLGKSTRAYIKRYFNKLKRCFPSVSWTTRDGGAASEDDVRAIIELNRARMAGKYKDSYIDDAEADRILQMVRRCGLVTVMTIDGKVCAGTINYRVADNYFLQVIAHAPAYDDYGLGTLCCYLTICECIARKGAEYHFLWGRYEYKYRLLGVQRDMSHMLVYRSRLHLLRNGAQAARHAWRGRMYEVKNWMEHRARRLDDSSVLNRAAYHGLNSLRNVKRSLDRIRRQRRPAAGDASAAVGKEPPAWGETGNARTSGEL
ncbi:MAG: GNAT family N-acetyltransferase [Bacillota bacterium]